ncbi:MAG TPA: N-formylglutamate deformylase [Steroidobacteraceae bacterium]|jgi:formiminoglutamase|nr:N-formylglutamate deformylase [Steroidobacteraceae bacterium]
MNDVSRSQWLTVIEGSAPIILCVPHAGIEIPAQYSRHLVSPWLARKDTDWWVDRLYDFAPVLGATVVRTAISRSIVDANRDPSGASLYPGKPTTALCPTTTFDGEVLYPDGAEPDAAQIEGRRRCYFDPYHAAIAAQLARLRHSHPAVVLYDCHSIRSVVPRLFAGVLPHFNIGTYDGASCSAQLAAAVEAACDSSGMSRVTNGRFKGGYTTRHYGDPARGVHAIQMELACRGYMSEPDTPCTPANWPPDYAEKRASRMRERLTRIIEACISFATGGGAR